MRRGTRPQVVRRLLKASIGSAAVPDNMGWLALHWAVKQQAGSEIIKELAMAYPPGVHTADLKGRAPIQLEEVFCASFLMAHAQNCVLCKRMMDSELLGLCGAARRHAWRCKAAACLCQGCRAFAIFFVFNLAITTLGIFTSLKE